MLPFFISEERFQKVQICQSVIELKSSHSGFIDSYQLVYESVII